MTTIGGQSSVTPTTSATNTSSTTSTTPMTMNPKGALGQNAFLQLLVTQLQNQDPLQPQNNTQMIAQLAQFSSLEQMTNISQTDTQVLSALQSLETMTSMAFAHQLIGTQVAVTDSSGTKTSGTVSAITMNQGQPQVVVGGTSYPMTQVVQMS